ncbi:hypothetical protein KJ570_02750 [Patescibacteria group bacterium]|nr:hypothetical protein [Patescibacteria group bacterium]MBU2035898.1 hypothetical protein [Patescibacteria group bacterium]
MTVKPKYFLLVISGLIFVFLALLVIFSDLPDKNLFQKFEKISGQKVTQNEEEIKVVDKNLPETEEIFLDIVSPKDMDTVSSSLLTIKGTTVASAEIFINDKETKADKSGNFSVNITLEEGENILTIIMNDSLGNYIEKQLTVTLESF